MQNAFSFFRTTNKHKIVFSLCAALFLTFPAHADDSLKVTPPISLQWPVKCTRGKNCWLVHHVDVNTRAGAATDYKCSALTYDAHKGIDIAIKDQATIKRNIRVLAAADGIVTRTRYNMPRTGDNAEERRVIQKEGKECGNGVILSHDNEWESSYCHMRKGSVLVRPGDTVTQGQTLGFIGQSGYSQFPHLHFSLRHNHIIIDPFTGKTAAEGGCNTDDAKPLWKPDIPYIPAMIFASGLSAQVPIYKDLVHDVSSFSPQTVQQNAKALILWGVFYGLKKNDHVHMEVRDPKNNVYFKFDDTVEKRQIRSMRYRGKKTRKVPLFPGTYTSTITLTRGERTWTEERSVEITK